AEIGPSLRPLGDPELIRAVCARVPELGPASSFGWMQTATAPAPDTRVGVLADADRPEVAELLDAAFPRSYARPGDPGVRPWVGGGTGGGGGGGAGGRGGGGGSPGRPMPGARRRSGSSPAWPPARRPEARD